MLFRRRTFSYQALPSSDGKGIHSSSTDHFTVAERLEQAHWHIDRNEIHAGWTLLGNVIAEDQCLVLSESQSAVEREPDNAQMYLRRGRVFVHVKDYESAINDYTRCIELEPGCVRAYNNRGNMYHQRAKYDRAIADYSTAIEIDPQFAAAYINRGLTYVSLRETALAIDNFTRAIEIDPSDPKPYWNRYLLYKGTGQRVLAQRDRKMALSSLNERRS